MAHLNSPYFFSAIVYKAIRGYMQNTFSNFQSAVDTLRSEHKDSLEKIYNFHENDLKKDLKQFKNHGMNWLHYTLLFNKLKMFRYLTEIGYNVNLQTSYQKTPNHSRKPSYTILHIATRLAMRRDIGEDERGCSLGFLQFILTHTNVDRSILDHKKRTALDIAENGKDKEVIELFSKIPQRSVNEKIPPHSVKEKKVVEIEKKQEKVLKVQRKQEKLEVKQNVMVESFNKTVFDEMKKAFQKTMLENKSLKEQNLELTNEVQKYKKLFEKMKDENYKIKNDMNYMCGAMRKRMDILVQNKYEEKWENLQKEYKEIMISDEWESKSVKLREEYAELTKIFENNVAFLESKEFQQIVVDIQKINKERDRHTPYFSRHLKEMKSDLNNLEKLKEFFASTKEKVDNLKNVENIMKKVKRKLESMDFVDISEEIQQLKEKLIMKELSAYTKLVVYVHKREVKSRTKFSINLSENKRKAWQIKNEMIYLFYDAKILKDINEYNNQIMKEVSVKNIFEIGNKVGKKNKRRKELYKKLKIDLELNIFKNNDSETAEIEGICLELARISLEMERETSKFLKISGDIVEKVNKIEIVTKNGKVHGKDDKLTESFGDYDYPNFKEIFLEKIKKSRKIISKLKASSVELFKKSEIYIGKDLRPGKTKNVFEKLKNKTLGTRKLVCVYFGNMRMGKRYGFGREYFKGTKKVKYEGEWENNKKYGQGVLYDKKGKEIRRGLFLDTDLSKCRGYDFNTLFKPDSKPIGEGAFAKVVPVTIEDEVYALKLISMNRYESMFEELRRDLYNEVAILSTLEHPNILRIKGWSKIKKQKEKRVNRFGIITEMCDLDLGKRFSKIVKTFSFEKKINILSQLARGVRYLHSRDPQIVHRDLKWENVLMKGDVVKIIDFGLAMKVTGNDHKPKKVGTPDFMAPELSPFCERGKYEYVPSKTDVYSYGIMAYKMLFETSDPYNLKQLYEDGKITGNKDIPRLALNGLRPKIPLSKVNEQNKWLVDIIQECWQANPNYRPYMEEVLTKIEDYISSLEVKKKDESLRLSGESLRSSGEGFSLRTSMESIEIQKDV